MLLRPILALKCSKDALKRRPENESVVQYTWDPRGPWDAIICCTIHLGPERTLGCYNLLYNTPGAREDPGML